MFTSAVPEGCAWHDDDHSNATADERALGIIYMLLSFLLPSLSGGNADAH